MDVKWFVGGGSEGALEQPGRDGPAELPRGWCTQHGRATRAERFALCPVGSLEGVKAG